MRACTCTLPQIRPNAEQWIPDEKTTGTAIIQRVLSASVTVEKEVISSIGKGVLVFAAVAPGDTEKEMKTIASKVAKMKLWDDESGGRVSQHSLATMRRSWPADC